MKGTPYKYDAMLFGKKEETPVIKDGDNDKLHAILRAEGTYFLFMRYMKRGAKEHAKKIIDDVYERYGENLDKEPSKGDENVTTNVKR